MEDMITRKNSKAKSLVKDDNGQIIIILAVIISVLLAGLSLLYAQNILAGNESAYTQLTFPKAEIQNLRNLVINELRYQAINNPNSFLDDYGYDDILNEQIGALYASHGSYAYIEVYNITWSAGDTITSFNVRIVFSNPMIDYESNERVII
jgi:hypothetical protein